MAKISNVEVCGLDRVFKTAKYPKAIDLGKLDNELTPGIEGCLTCRQGEGHDNALKGIVVYFDMTVSEKCWPQAQRYHWLEFVSSQSTMHKIAKFSIKEQCNRYVDRRIIDILQEKVNEYNRLTNVSGCPEEVKDKLYLEILYNIPSGFELTAGMVTNYQQLKTIYHQRRHHRLPDWQVFCDWIESLPYSYLITGKEQH